MRRLSIAAAVLALLPSMATAQRVMNAQDVASALSYSSGKTVFLGGVVSDFCTAMSTSAVSVPAIAAGIGLYEHANGMAACTPAQRAAIWSAWASTGLTNGGGGQALAEIGGFASLPAGYTALFGGAYPNEGNVNIISGAGDGSASYTASASDAHPGTVYTGYYHTGYSFTGSISGSILTVTAAGAVGPTANAVLTGAGIAAGTTIVTQLTGSTGGAGTYQLAVNGNTTVNQTVASETIAVTSDLATISSAAAVAIAAGAVNQAVFITPNGGGEDLDDPFATGAFWANARAAALLTGGLALDVPSTYAFARTPAYRAMIAQMIQWAVANNLRASLVVSPFATSPDALGHSAGQGYDPSFYENTQRLVGYLMMNNALPTQVVVESYAGTAWSANGILSSSGAPGGIMPSRESLLNVALYLAHVLRTSAPGTAVPGLSGGQADAGLMQLPSQAALPAMTPSLRSARISLAQCDGCDDMAGQNSGNVSIWGGNAVLSTIVTSNATVTGIAALLGPVGMSGLPTTAQPANNLWVDGSLIKRGTEARVSTLDLTNLDMTGELAFHVGAVVAFDSGTLPACAAGIGSGRLCTGTGGGSTPLSIMP